MKEEYARLRRKIPGEGGRYLVEEKDAMQRKKMPSGGGRCKVEEEYTRWK